MDVARARAETGEITLACWTTPSSRSVMAVEGWSERPLRVEKRLFFEEAEAVAGGGKRASRSRRGSECTCGRPKSPDASLLMRAW